jgi:Arc/MetJ family transcription regulator
MIHSVCRQVFNFDAVHISVRSLHIEDSPVRTNIEIDDQLLSEAMRSSGARTKKAAVEAGLRLLVQTHSQAAARQLRGKVQWEGDLNESRSGRNQG